MSSPVVVITGSTKGIGFGMARAFLDRGCRVVVSGRDARRVREAAARLAGDGPAGQVLGRACDVADQGQVQALWDAAMEAFQSVDVWINNAALGSVEQDFWEHDPDTIEAVIRTNLLGTLHGARVAARGMLAQGHGQIYTVEGWGSANEMRRGSTLYGTSKAAIRYFTRSLAAELRRTPVRLCTINPGLVATDLLALSVRPEQEANIRRFINIFGDRVETVAPALVERVLANRRHNARIAWLPPWRMLARALAAPFRRRRIID
jgi:NAD(P)-dependent dehydrogenase (short-subunit alcohol dehydrogenase family)